MAYWWKACKVILQRGVTQAHSPLSLIEGSRWTKDKGPRRPGNSCLCRVTCQPLILHDKNCKTCPDMKHKEDTQIICVTRDKARIQYVFNHVTRKPRILYLSSKKQVKQF